MAEIAAPMPAASVQSFDSDVLHSGIFARLAVVGALLRFRKTVGADLASGRNLSDYVCSLFIATLLFTAGYGAVLGMFQPGIQTLFAAAKLPIVVLGTALLCTPTFYVFNSILGSTLNFRQTVALVFVMTAAVATILAAFAPIAWFFTVSAGTLGFLIGLHLVVFLVALLYAERLISSLREILQSATGGPSVSRLLLTVWILLVGAVGLQMAWNFRPFLSEGPFVTGTRSLCLEALKPLAPDGEEYER
ncbi:MAG: hypothetical protein K8T20_14275 [Planctomycetes bacterium]|nr:hypothetical protein [Planctomycetota bacterium]